MEGGSWEKEDEGKGREEMKGLEGGILREKVKGIEKEKRRKGRGGRERERRKESKFIIHFLFQLSNFI